MVKMTVRICTVQDANRFVNICNAAGFDIDLLSGRYVVNAKSIMGIFSLDLTKPIELHADCSDDNEIICKLRSFVAE